MQLNPRFEMSGELKLVGRHRRMSFSRNTTPQLWQDFMPLRHEIACATGSDLYSVEIYNDTCFFSHFSPDREFEKWAAIRVTGFQDIPDGMDPLTIPDGLYAVFVYHGKASEAAGTYQAIFASWLPSSSYVLDDRPHFALMGDKYKNEDPDSEEELWIPVAHR